VRIDLRLPSIELPHSPATSTAKTASALAFNDWSDFISLESAQQATFSGNKSIGSPVPRSEAIAQRSKGELLSNLIVHNHTADGVDRRGFLRCMAWAGTGIAWTLSSGIPTSRAFGQEQQAGKGELHFVQISDSHIGFNRPANPDVNGTLQTAIDKINALPQQPEFIIHTGDLTHSSRANEYDTLDQLLLSAKPKQLFFVPGEHDTASDDGTQYFQRYGKGAEGRGWYSFNHKDVHFVGLSNVAVQEGLGQLGGDQIKWLEADLKGQPSSRPIVVFAHIPLWSVYPDWGWATADSAQALGQLKRFGSVTVLNGHIHQAMQKVEGNVIFHTAMSTAFPQPAPGAAKAAGPMQVPDDKLRSVLGISNVQSVMRTHSLAIVDSTLDTPASTAELEEYREQPA
jgi:Icc protein